MAPQATQDFVPIKEIRDGVVILKDGSYRAILITSAVNLALKSVDEQNGVIYMFQNFLNSLDFSIQIVTQSRKLDLNPYLRNLRAREELIEEPLLKLQTKEYINFIGAFSKEVDIMKRNFFVVVPFSPNPINTKGGIFSSLFGKKNTDVTSKENFSESFSQLQQRIALVSSGLSRVGVRSKVLEDKEAIELFYNAFNIGEGLSSLKIDDK
jgi:hypothetical protein